MQKLCCWAVLLALVISFAEQTVSAKSTHNATIDTRIESILHWLPADTESIAVLQAPVTYDLESDQPIDPESVYESSFVQNPHICANEVPFSDELVIPISEFLLCVQSAGKWEYKSDKKSGTRTIGYFTFLSPNQARDKEMKERCEKNAVSKFIASDQQVYEFVLEPCNCKPKGIKQSLYKCFPKPGLVIVTFDTSLMHQILNEIRKTKTAWRALPEHLPEWKEVNMKERYWGLRHFQADDPTSPRSIRSENVTGYPYPKPDAQAIGMVFSYASKSQTLDVKYLSTNPNSVELVKAMLVPRGFGKFGPTEIQLTKPNIVHMRAHSSGDEWNRALNCVHPWLGVPPPWPL